MLADVFGMIGIIIYLGVCFLLFDDRYVRTIGQHRVVSRRGDSGGCTGYEIPEDVRIIRWIIWQDRIGLVVGIVIFKGFPRKRLSTRICRVQL